MPDPETPQTVDLPSYITDAIAEARSYVSLERSMNPDRFRGMTMEFPLMGLLAAIKGYDENCPRLENDWTPPAEHRLFRRALRWPAACVAIAWINIRDQHAPTSIRVFENRVRSWLDEFGPTSHS